MMIHLPSPVRQRNQGQKDADDVYGYYDAGKTTADLVDGDVNDDNDVDGNPPTPTPTPHPDFLITLANKESVSLDWLLLGKGRMRRR